MQHEFLFSFNLRFTCLSICVCWGFHTLLQEDGTLLSQYDDPNDVVKKGLRLGEARRRNETTEDRQVGQGRESCPSAIRSRLTLPCLCVSVLSSLLARIHRCSSLDLVFVPTCCCCATRQARVRAMLHSDFEEVIGGGGEAGAGAAGGPKAYSLESRTTLQVRFLCFPLLRNPNPTVSNQRFQILVSSFTVFVYVLSASSSSRSSPNIRSAPPPLPIPSHSERLHDRGRDEGDLQEEEEERWRSGCR